jgi:hypothetical protein
MSRKCPNAFGEEDSNAGVMCNWCRLLLLIRCRFVMRWRKRKIGTMVLLHPS